MGMHVNTLKQIIKNNSDYLVAEKAVYLLTIRSEQWVIDTIRKAEGRLREQNKARETRGIPTKSKITYELLMDVLENAD